MAYRDEHCSQEEVVPQLISVRHEPERCNIGTGRAHVHTFQEELPSPYNKFTKTWNRLGVFGRSIVVGAIILTCILSVFDTLLLEKIQNSKNVSETICLVAKIPPKNCSVRDSVLEIAKCPAFRTIENNLLDYCKDKNVTRNYIVHSDYRHGVLRITLI